MRIGLWLLLGLLGGCNYRESKLANQSKGPGVVAPQVINDFASFESVIAKPYCLRCHTGDDSRGGPLDGGYQFLVDGGYIVPFEPNESRLYVVIEEGSMPPRNSPKPTAAELKLLKDWITNGAKETL